MTLRARVRTIGALYCLFAASLAGGPASAQMGDGVAGWRWSGIDYATAEEACRAQWVGVGMDNGFSRFITARDTQNWWAKDCSWTSFQYLCPQETGGGLVQCWTVLPASVFFYCETGYERASLNRCVRPEERQPERPSCAYNNGAEANPQVGRPILLSTGAKLLQAEDFASEGMYAAISRSYRSMPVGSSVSFNYVPLGLPLGWQFDFTLELQIGVASGSPSSPNVQVTVVTPDGSGYDFILLSNGEWAPRAASGVPTTDVRLSFEGTLPSNLADLKTATTEWTVVDAGNTTWKLRTSPRPNTSVWAVARPFERIDAEGRGLTYEYGARDELEKIEDAFGNEFLFSWNYFFVTALTGISGSEPVPEAVSEIVLPDGSSIRYLYDPPPAVVAPSTSRIARLVGVEWYDDQDLLVDSVVYHYEDSRFATHVTGVTDHANKRIATYAYDGWGRAVLSEGGDSADRIEIAYARVGNDYTRTVTNALGKETVYHFHRFSSSPNDIRLVSVDGEPSPNCPASSRTYDYDGNRFISETVDEEGRVTRYVRDASGLPTSVTQGFGEPEARTRTITWDTGLRLPLEIVEPGLTATFAYDAQGRLASRTLEDTTSHTTPYPTNGQTRIWTFAYTAEGLLESVDGPLAGTGDTVSYAYTAEGFLASVTDEVGHVTLFTAHDGVGRPLTMEDPNGVETAFTYDARGRLLTSTVDPGPSQAVTAYQYDLAGNLERLTLPDGSWFEFAYDADDRIVAVENIVGETIAYDYDAMGNRTRMVVRDGSDAIVREVDQTFDELGRLLSRVGAKAQPFRFAYDRTDNLVTVTDPRSNDVDFAFDALNRLYMQVDQVDSEIELTLNAQDEAIVYDDPRGLQTTFVRNGFGEVIEETSPDTGTTVYVLNALGLPVEITDARGVVTELAYDDAGRLLSKTYPGSTGENVVYGWDDTAGGNAGIGRLTSVTDATGSTAYVYDARGAVVSELRTIDSEAHAVAYVYDEADNVVEMTYPSGRIVTYGRNALGRIQWVTTQENASASAQTLASNVYFMPYGPLQSLGYGNGLSLWKTFDADYDLGMLLVEDIPASSLLIHRFHTYTDNLNLTNIWDEVDNDRDQSFWYSPTNRLQNADGLWGSLLYYHDRVGNRTHEIVDDGSSIDTRVFGYPSGSNRLVSVTENAATIRSFGYDAAGNIVSETRGSVDWTFSHNHAGRLSRVEADAVLQGAYVYDGLDRLGIREIATVSPAATIHLIHDLAGRLIAETDGAGQTVREYVWLDDMPLAVVKDVDSTPEILFVHVDHIDRPVAMTDGAKAQVWDATYLPFGGALQITGPEALDPRFPGQWFQLESGLHYNWRRHYDPTTGRYLEPDPLGLIDGPSLYAYARSSPQMYVDPTGEWAFLLPVVTGGAAGFAIDAGLQYWNDGCVDWGTAFWRGGLAGAGAGAGIGWAARTGGFGAGLREFARDQSGAGPRNILRPDRSAVGPHSVFKRGADGRITRYETYRPNPRNPSGFDKHKAFDAVGKPHFNKYLDQHVHTPHIQSRSILGGIRPARKWEIPK